MHNIDNYINFLYSRRSFAKSATLNRCRALLAELGNPQNELEFVHVAGTNGKGSTASFIYYSLCAAGINAGLFISPFVYDFRERIQLNGSLVDENLFCSCAKRLVKAVEAVERNGNEPTFFECLFALALLCFSDAGIKIAVIEAGIGGRDDSTNVIPAPLAAVITSVSLDHTAVLGSTVAEIAANKAGIIKPGSSVVSFPKSSGNFDFAPQSEAACHEIEAACNAAGVSLVYPDMCKTEIIAEREAGLEFSYRGGSYVLNMPGVHQLANAAVAVETLKILQSKGLQISQKHIEQGVEATKMPGRTEIIHRGSKTIIIDGGHNPGCMNALANTLKSCFSGKRAIAVMAFMSEKDFKRSLEIIAPLCERIIFTRVDENRGAPPEILAKAAEPFCKNTTIAATPAEAFGLAENYGVELIVVTGSFYLAAPAKEYFSMFRPS